MANQTVNTIRKKIFISDLIIYGGKKVLNGLKDVVNNKAGNH